MPNQWAAPAEEHHVQRYRFGRYDKIIIGNVEYRWVDTDHGGHRLRRQDEGELVEWLSHDDIQRHCDEERFACFRDWYQPARAKLRAADWDKLLSDLEPDERKKVLWRQDFCDRFLRMEARKEATRSDASMARAIRIIHRELEAVEIARAGKKPRAGQKRTSLLEPPSPSCLRKWLKRYQDFDYHPIALCDRYGKSGNRTSRVSPESSLLAWKFAKRYQSSHRPTKAMLFKDYCEAVEADNVTRAAAGEATLHMLCQRSFEILIEKLDPYHTLAAREGEARARQKFGIVMGGLVTTRPLERVEMDEWNVSLQTLLVDAGVWEHLTPQQRDAVERSRTWLSAAICTATRYVLALRLTTAAPSASSAIATLEMALFPKTHVERTVCTLSPWMYGSMETLAMDSGSGFIAAEFQAVVRDCKVEAINPPSGVPELRARIERLFGTFQRHFMKYFSGQTFENIISKGDYDSEGNASVNVKELNRTLIRYVVDAYHNTPHDGLAGETPLNAWLRLSKKYGVLPQPTKAERRHIFGLSLMRRIQNKGVRILGIHYQSKELQLLRRTVGQKEVLVRVDRFNLGEVSIQTRQGWISAAPAIRDLDLSDVTLWDWAAAAADLAKRNADMSKLSLDTVRAALAEVRETADLAIQRAELGTPILDAAALETIDDRLFRSFGFAVHGQTGDEDILGTGDAPTDDIEVDGFRAPNHQPPYEAPDGDFGTEEDIF